MEMQQFQYYSAKSMAEAVESPYKTQFMVDEILTGISYPEIDSWKTAIGEENVRKDDFADEGEWKDR